MMAMQKCWRKLNPPVSQALWSRAIKPPSPNMSRSCDHVCHAATQPFPRCPKRDVPQVLLIHRGKPPATGGLCFPGGRVELGESLSVAATREVKEETGIDVWCKNPPAPLQVSDPDPDHVPHPRPVTTIDGIYHSDDGKLAYHYAIVEMIATVVDPEQEPTPADDADTAAWIDVHNVKANDRHENYLSKGSFTKGLHHCTVEAVKEVPLH